MDNTKVKQNSYNNLPKLDCGACGYKTCNNFAEAVDNGDENIEKCINLVNKTICGASNSACVMCTDNGESMAEKMGWKDNLDREFDFLLDIFENEPGPREIILLYNPLLVKELGIKENDIIIGRPMGMSCGCPVTHCGIVQSADYRNGVIEWCVTGPLGPRTKGFKDVGYYIAEGYEGIVKESKKELTLGKRYWFMPRKCMLQWRHSGLLNTVTKQKDGSYKIRIEGLFIG